MDGACPATISGTPASARLYDMVAGSTRDVSIVRHGTSVHSPAARAAHLPHDSSAREVLTRSTPPRARAGPTLLQQPFFHPACAFRHRTRSAAALVLTRYAGLHARLLPFVAERTSSPCAHCCATVLLPTTTPTRAAWLRLTCHHHTRRLNNSRALARQRAHTVCLSLPFGTALPLFMQLPFV